MNLFGLAQKAAEVKADADQTMLQFDPAWLVGAIGAQLKRFAINALAADPKLDSLAARLGTDRDQARILWNTFLQHLKEDF